MRNARKRRTTKFPIIWKYKKPEIVRRTKTTKNGIPIYTHEGILLKVCQAVTKWLQLSGTLDSPPPPMVEWAQSEEVSTIAADDRTLKTE